MGLIRNLRNALSSFKHPEQWLINWAGGGMTTNTGITVTDTRALGAPAVLCALRNLSESVAMLPQHTFEVTGNTRKKAIDNPLYWLLYNSPNPEMTAFTRKEWVMNSLLFYGNAYCEIERNNAGEPIALWPLLSPNMCVTRENEVIRYTYSLGGKSVDLPVKNVLHYRGFSMGGLLGLSLKELGKEAIGIIVAADEFAGRVYQKGTLAGGIVKSDKTYTAEAKGRILNGIASATEGLSKAHRLLMLDEGMQWENLGINPKDAQNLEGRQYGVLETARIFNIPPHRLYDLSNAHLTNIEHQGIEYVVYSLMPWLVRIEQQDDKTLIRPEDRGRLYTRHNVNMLLRGDTASRYSSYALMRQWGILNADEIRDLEEMNPLPNGVGTVYYAPLNMVNAESLLQVSEPKPLKSCDHDHDETRSAQPLRVKLRGAWEKPLAREFSRVVRGEIREIRKLVKSHLGTRDAVDFMAALKAYYEDPEQFLKFAQGAMGPLFAAYAAEIAKAATEEIGNDKTVPPIDEFIKAYGEKWAERFAGDHLETLSALVEENAEDLDAQIEERIAQWDESAGDSEANKHSVELEGAVALAVWSSLGVKKIRWQASPAACPICKQLDGKVVGREQTFAGDGDELQSSDGKQPLKITWPVKHSPLHKGCTCFVVPG